MHENGASGGRELLQRVVYPILRPLMRLLRYRTGRRLRQLPQPLDAPHVHAPGADPDRILLFGSGPAIGYGVLSNDLALPGHLARQLSATTGRGVDLDVVADPEVTIQGSLSLLRELNLWRYDAILLTIGVNNALLLTSVRVWRFAVLALLLHVVEHVPRGTRVLVVAVPPIRSIDSFTRLSGWIADRHAVVLNRETRRIVANFPRITYVPFSPLDTADDIRYRSAATYQKWATLIVAPLSQQLAEEPRSEAFELSPDEEARQAALDALGILDTGPEERFDRITLLASQLFGTNAAITFIDHDRHWVKSAVGFDRSESPREGSFGNIAIHSAGVYVVEDAAESHDPENYYGIRFYAGCPIESAFGERVGLISVFSTQPRTWSVAETELLRDLALQVQRELLDV
jgi:hypothetical protein